MFVIVRWSPVVNLVVCIDLIIYRWAVNSSYGWKDITSSSPTVAAADKSQTSSKLALTTSETLRFRPENEADFGTVGCWALNDVGWQKDPCIFNISPAGTKKQSQLCTIGFSLAFNEIIAGKLLWPGY